MWKNPLFSYYSLNFLVSNRQRLSVEDPDSIPYSWLGVYSHAYSVYSPLHLSLERKLIIFKSYALPRCTMYQRRTFFLLPFLSYSDAHGLINNNLQPRTEIERYQCEHSPIFNERAKNDVVVMIVVKSRRMIFFLPVLHFLSLLLFSRTHHSISIYSPHSPVFSLLKLLPLWLKKLYPRSVYYFLFNIPPIHFIIPSFTPSFPLFFHDSVLVFHYSLIFIIFPSPHYSRPLTYSHIPHPTVLLLTMGKSFPYTTILREIVCLWKH